MADSDIQKLTQEFLIINKRWDFFNVGMVFCAIGIWSHPLFAWPLLLCSLCMLYYAYRTSWIWRQIQKLRK